MIDGLEKVHRTDEAKIIRNAGAVCGIRSLKTTRFRLAVLLEFK